MSARILVVEDDPRNLYLVKYLLEKSGYEVIVAHNGEEGVEAARKGRPDLVLMDMLLPKMDGYSATREIKAIPGLEDVRVVALTAYSMKGDKVRIIDAGCEGHIPKPLDPVTFVDSVEAFFAERDG